MPDGAPLFAPSLASWRQIYRRDLVMDLWGPEKLSRAEISAMLEGLPAETALWRSINKTGQWGYGYAEQLAEVTFVSAEKSRSLLHWLAGTKMKNPSKFKALDLPTRPWLSTVTEPDAPAEMTLDLFQQMTAQMSREFNG